ncbi:hypothetical protein [Kordiimonas aestuarii]|uniref:hypothetical protein n=1 Tax=Kordiimonas aestuarii TaxID=1005925 RepID=UPI0021D2D5BE|nr:hypothetical protein [Kordiimonas aestuarii]
MIRLIVLLLLLACTSFSALAADDQERAVAARQNAEAVVAQYVNVRDEDTLRRINRDVERVWQEFVRYHGAEAPFAPQYALIRARAASAAQDKQRVVPLWHEAIRVNAGTSPAFIMGLDIEAAHAAAEVGEAEHASRFFASARSYAFVRGDRSDQTRLQLRVRELQVLGNTMPWRDLNDALLDLREYSETFPMWTLPRLEALLSETEIRLALAPEDKEKREELSGLKAKIILIQKGMNRDLPASFTARIRTLYYALEDRYHL